MKVYGTRDADAFCFPSSPPDDGSDVKPDRILEPRASNLFKLPRSQRNAVPASGRDGAKYRFNLFML